MISCTVVSGAISISTILRTALLGRYCASDAVRNIVEIEIAPDTTVHQIIDSYHVPRASAHLILINGLYVEPEDRDRPMLQAGDALAIWPPVAGG